MLFIKMKFLKVLYVTLRGLIFANADLEKIRVIFANERTYKFLERKDNYNRKGKENKIFYIPLWLHILSMLITFL